MSVMYYERKIITWIYMACYEIHALQIYLPPWTFLQILVIFVLGACFAFFFAGKIIGLLGMVLWKGQRTSIWNEGIPCCLWTCQISIIGSTRSPSLKLYPSIYGRHCEVCLFSLHPILLQSLLYVPWQSIMFFLHTFILDDFFLYVRLNLTVGICFMGFKQNAKIYWHISRKNDIISSAMYFNFLFYGTIPWGYLMPLLEKLPIVAEEEKWNERRKRMRRKGAEREDLAAQFHVLSLYISICFSFGLLVSVNSHALRLPLFLILL